MLKEKLDTMRVELNNEIGKLRASLHQIDRKYDDWSSAHEIETQRSVDLEQQGPNRTAETVAELKTAKSNKIKTKNRINHP